LIINNYKMVNKNYKKSRILGIVPCLFLVCSIAFINSICNKPGENVNTDTTKKKLTIQFVKQGEVYFQDKKKNLVKQIDVEIADTDNKRHTGLMFREKMDSSQGMLFIFPNEEDQAFYMKNTIIPLDIIFINGKKQIVKIYKHTTPYSEKDLPSFKPVLYVIEVNAGFTDKYNIKEGDYIDFRRF